MSNRTLTARHVLADFRGGSSLPVLVETENGENIVIKWKCTAEGPAAIATDWVCLHLARMFGIKVPEPVKILVTPELARPGMDPDITDLIKRSIGVNLGLAYIPESRPLQNEDLAGIDSATRDRIFIFDVLFLNIDRTGKNPNMLISNGDVYCIDFAAAIGVKMFVEGTDLSIPPLVSLLRQHPFYSQRPDTARFVSLASKISVDSPIDELPEEWLAPGKRDKLRSGLVSILAQASQLLPERIENLVSIQVESEEMYRERTMRNRLAFEETVRRLMDR